MQRGLILRIKPILLLSYLPGIFYITNLIRMLGLSTFYYNVFLIVAGGIGLMVALFATKDNMTPIWLFVALYLFTLAFSWFIIGNIAFDNILSTSLLIGIAILMILHPWGYRFGTIVFYLSAFLLLYRMSGASSRRLLTSSANYNSVAILLAVFFYYISIDNTGRQLRLIDLLPAVLCVFISLWAEGRGGILSCTFLLIMILLCYMRNITGKNTRRTIIVIIGLIVAGIIMYYYNFSLIDSFLGLGKWGSRGTVDSARIYIWTSYLSKIKESALYFFFGVPLDQIPVIEAYGGNTHNSFIQLHAYNGFFMFAAMAVYIFKAGRYFFRQRNYLTMIMMITIVIRSLTDKFIFGQYGMPIMVYFILLPYISKQRALDTSSEGTIDKEV